jgi:hypothetical protein
MRQMSDEKMIRLDNLKQILRHRQLDAQGLSDATIGKDGRRKWSRSQCADLIAGRKSFGEKAARYLEEQVLGIPRFWLDQIHSDDGSDVVGDQLPSVATSFVHRSATQPPADQVVSAEPIYAMSGLDEGFPSTPVILDVGSSSLMPVIPTGALVRVKPCGPADVKTGDYVLVRPFDSGNGFFSVYTALPGGGFEVQDATGKHFNSNTHGTILLGRVTRVMKDY